MYDCDMSRRVFLCFRVMACMYPSTCWLSFVGSHMRHRSNPFFQEKIKRRRGKATTKLSLFSFMDKYPAKICSGMSFGAVFAFKQIKCMHVDSWWLAQKQQLLLFLYPHHTMLLWQLGQIMRMSNKKSLCSDNLQWSECWLRIRFVLGARPRRSSRWRSKPSAKWGTSTWSGSSVTAQKGLKGR